MRTNMFPILALVALSFLAACAGPAAQSVTLAPQVQVPAGDVGRGRTLALRVDDGRADRMVLGYRDVDGGRTAPISSSGDLPAIVGEAAMRPLADMGFKPGPFREGAPLSLVITIRELEYRAWRTGMTKRVGVRCTLEARVTNGAGGWQGSFPVSQEQEMVRTPGVNENARFINSALSESLRMLFASPEFIRALDREPIQPKKVKK